MPLPARSRRCPGSTETASSASGAPMKTEGTKSTKEWTTEAAITQHPTATAASVSPSGSAVSRAGYAASSIAASVLT